MRRLRRQTRLLKKRAIESMLLAIEFFNRPSETGRTESVLLFTQHAFEMLLKATIFQNRGTIFDKNERFSYRFERCLNILKSDLNLISDDEARTLSTINGLRDSAVHYVSILSEDQLYLHTQSALTLFDDLLNRFFGERLSRYLPDRVFPISTKPLQDITMLLDKEFGQIKDMVALGKRQRAEAMAKLRPLLIMESNVTGEGTQPMDKEISKVIKRLRKGEHWAKIFRGISTLELETEGSGVPFSLRITTRQGLPIRPATPNDNSSQIIAYREVNLLDRYSLRCCDIAEKIGLTSWKTLALIYHLKIQKDASCFKEFRMGSSSCYKRYSPKALEKIKDSLPIIDTNKVWQEYRNYQRDRKKAKS